MDKLIFRERLRVYRWQGRGRFASRESRCAHVVDYRHLDRFFAWLQL
jgi:hypothetical protein